MKNKILCSVVLWMFLGSAALANVVSWNIVGYFTIIVPPGFSMIANGLSDSGSTVGKMIERVDEGTTLYKWKDGRFEVNTYMGGVWDNPNMTLEPGEGAIIFNPTQKPFFLTFVGQVNLKSKFRLGAGYSILSMPYPADFKLANIEKGDLAFPVAEGDVIYLLRGGQYVTSVYTGGQWSNPNLVIGVGESFFFKNGNGIEREWNSILRIEGAMRLPRVNLLQ